MPVISAFQDCSIIDLETSSNSFLSGLEIVLLSFLATRANQCAKSPAVPPKYPRGPIKTKYSVEGFPCLKLWFSEYLLNFSGCSAE